MVATPTGFAPADGNGFNCYFGGREVDLDMISLEGSIPIAGGLLW